MTARTIAAPFALGPLPEGRLLRTVDERTVHAPLAAIFALAASFLRTTVEQMVKTDFVPALKKAGVGYYVISRVVYGALDPRVRE